MKCPKCSGALRLMSNGFYRNAVETPMSVSCLNCGFYAEKPPEVVETREVKKAEKQYHQSRSRLSTYGTYRSIIRDEIQTIRQCKLKRMKWVDIIELLAIDYPEIRGIAPRKMQKAFGAVHGEFCEGRA